jgi:nitrogen-specific signal transduction histidine kinase
VDGVSLSGYDLIMTLPRSRRGIPGSGIPDDLKQRVFERNQRGATKKSGKGLGLYIVRMLVERYTGSVRIPGHPEGGDCRHTHPAALPSGNG